LTYSGRLIPAIGSLAASLFLQSANWLPAIICSGLLIDMEYYIIYLTPLRTFLNFFKFKNKISMFEYERKCSGSRRRGVEKVDKRMVLEYTHGLFIT
jgi:hypothetical protein